MKITWIEKHKRVWRVSILVLLLVAFLGPWTFDLIWVPSEYSCSLPFVRLDGDFCGVPMSGYKIFYWMISGFINSSEELVTGGSVFFDWVRALLFSLLISLPLLPIFSTLFLILRGDHPRGQRFAIAACCLAFFVGLFWGLNNYPKMFLVVWGIWLYIGLVSSALILEMLTMTIGRRLRQR